MIKAVSQSHDQRFERDMQNHASSNKSEPRFRIDVPRSGEYQGSKGTDTQSTVGVQLY